VLALRDTLERVDPQSRGRLEAWCEWASRWADQNDPLHASALLTGLEAPEAMPGLEDGFSWN
jgi:hypothetical protein